LLPILIASPSKHRGDSMDKTLRRLLTSLAVLLAGAQAGSPAAPHPLDPLSAGEIETAVAVLRAAGAADAATRYPLIDLDEPDKGAVLAWRGGERENRRALVVARRDRRVYQAVVDLGGRRVVEWRIVPGVESALLDEEITRARRITEADAVADNVFCAPLAAGRSADPREAGRRLVRVVSLLGWNDRGKRRLVLYRGSLAEMFVPYMDGDRDWSFRSYMDEGELGLGLSSPPLTPGIYCSFRIRRALRHRGQGRYRRSRLCAPQRPRTRL
jgi:Cu2+-containing amine oxidase